MIRIKRLLLILFVGVCLLSLSLPHLLLNAQNAPSQPTIVSIAIPEYLASNFSEDIFKDFEADNPGIKVHLIKTGQDTFVPPAAFGLEDTLKGAEKYAKSADVLFIDSYSLSPQAVRAGNFLNLAPLTQDDATFNQQDFLPAALETFQWDNGVWGLPVSVDFQIFTYNKDAFDKAGVAYPDERWTLDDLATAVRKLSEKDSDGKVKVPGLLAYNTDLLAYSFTGETFYDDKTQPTTPQLNKPALITFLDQWAKLQEEGVVSGGASNVDYNAVPIRIDGSYGLYDFPGSGQISRVGALLPGGKAGLTVQGFSISGGTQAPDKAYAVLKYLTSSPKVSSRFFSGRPARTSLIGVKADDSVSVPKLSAEAQTIADKAFANAIPNSKLRFGDYINQANNKMQTDKVDAKTALVEAETSAIADLKTAEERRASTALVVATPIPTPVLAAGQVTIRFNLQANVSPLPNKEIWDRAIKDFTEKDTEVKQIIFDTGFSSGKEKVTDKYDCMVTSYNSVQNMDVKDYLPLDPLLSVDAAFDKSDVFTGVMEQLQKDGKTWGYPVTLEPQVLFYNVDAFTKANVPAPKPDWGVAEFLDALKALKPTPKDPEPFTSQNYGANNLMMLIAVYGGMPLDPRTNPATINFTDPANVDAIRQVLDLAKHGYLKYMELANNGGGFGGGTGDMPLYSDMLDAISYRNYTSSGSSEYKNPYKLAQYPRGTKFNVVSFNIGTAYISAKAANPQACYRWIQYLANRVDLFQSMPARRSLLHESSLASSQGSDVTAIYNDIDSLLQDTKTVVMAGAFNGNSIGNYFLQFWLNRAFDHYVLKDADLEQELKDAQTYAKVYQACVAAIPPNTAVTDEELTKYYQQYMDCVVKADPSLKSMFQPQQ